LGARHAFDILPTSAALRVVPVSELIAGNPFATALLLFSAGAAFAWWLSTRQTAQQLRRLADQAEAIAGTHEAKPISGKGEMARLAGTLHKLSTALEAQTRELEDYSEALNRAHTRFGEALRATHDLDKMLAVALETGIETVRASSGLLMLRKGPGTLTVGVNRNLDTAQFTLDVGQGISGHVAATGTPLVIPGAGDVTRDDVEPPARTQLSVPLFSQNRVLAVLNLYDKQDGNFTDADLRTIVSLCDQAGVAIENVLLHQEAQRMAIMDGLTGIWNHRWFQIQFAQELDRAERFRRPFSLIVLDIDDFKSFNDTYGHQAGDFVLVELARRIKSSIRDVDMFARYGGEEFELLLSETDLAGGLNAAEKIREAIGGSPFTSDMLPKPLEVTVSVGVASYPEAGLDAPTIFKSADLAMYSAKSQGKNRVAGHCPSG
jgi:two-component system cell cycle response regulator